jgi:hypothetical protein
MELQQLFSQLPEDIVNIVLEYQGFHKDRNGKFIGQIKQNDIRRKLLLKIPRNCGGRHANSVELIKMFDEQFYRVNIGVIVFDEQVFWFISFSKMLKMTKGRFEWKCEPNRTYKYICV